MTATEPCPDRRRRDTRDRLIDAAIHVYRRQGPGGSGLAEVCEAGGVTKGVFSHHFPGGKDELLAAAVARAAVQVTAQMEREIAAAPTLGSAVRAMFEGYADLLDVDADTGCPLAAAIVDVSSADADVRDLTRVAFAQWTDRLAGLLRDGGWAAEDATDLALTIVAAMEGAILLSRTGGDGAALRRTGRWLAGVVDTPPT